MQQVGKNKVVSIFYKLSDEDGNALEDNRGDIPMAYLHGHNNLLSGLETELEGLSEGDSKTVTLPPEKAYGQRRENAVQRVPIKHLASKHKRLMAGSVVRVQTERGALPGKVVKAGRFMVDVDLNHPFAGKTLCFEVFIQSIRDALPEEVQHGHAHGPGGHHH